MAIDTASERIGSPAPSYAAHRQRAVAASFAAGIVVILALTATYAVLDLVRTPNPWEAITYIAMLLVPPVALLRARGPLHRHVAGVVIAGDDAAGLLHRDVGQGARLHRQPPTRRAAARRCARLRRRHPRRPHPAPELDAERRPGRLRSPNARAARVRAHPGRHRPRDQRPQRS